MNSKGNGDFWAWVNNLSNAQGFGLLCSVFGLFGLLLIPIWRKKDI